MEFKFRFYKSPQGGWWLDLPAYTVQGGNPADLKMVAGTDEFLENLAGENVGEVRLEMTDKKTMAFAREFSMLRRCDEIPTVAGVYYFDDASDNLMWMGDLLRWIFEGKFPETIWYKKL